MTDGKCQSRGKGDQTEIVSLKISNHNPRTGGFNIKFSLKTISTFLQIEGITLSADENIYVLAGRTSCKNVDGIGKDNDRVS
jgi:hypothetical protein